jgi:hypothetical protein
MEATDASTATGSLRGYTEAKLKLASIGEILLGLAQKRKDEERIHVIQQLLADLAEDAFRLAVGGKYNRGKSSLMNAMLGHDWLPTGILPLTSVIATVRYGTNQRVIKIEGSSLSREVPLEELPQYVTEEHNPGNRKRVAVAELQLPSDLLRYGFLFIDTPGLGSGILANTEATRRFLPEIDAAIVVPSFESALDQADMDLLVTLRRQPKRENCRVCQIAVSVESRTLDDRPEAVQLYRLAQDMQQFALKHNALRHDLTTEGEQDAYFHGLMQLVGARQLSFVRKIQDLI